MNEIERAMNYEAARVAIAKVVHLYDHPDYDTVTFCVFCLDEASRLLSNLPPKEEL